MRKRHVSLSWHIPPMWLIFHGSGGNSRVDFVAPGMLSRQGLIQRDTVVKVDKVDFDKGKKS